MEFFAFHGYYDEEQKIGNKYGVDLYIKTNLLAAGESDKLQQTVNYEVLYRLVAEEMRAPARLLEHVAHLDLPAVAQVVIDGPHGGRAVLPEHVQDFQLRIRRFGGRGFAHNGRYEVSTNYFVV